MKLRTVAAAAALCLPVAPAASATEWSTFVLHGDRSASVEITVDEAWHVPSHSFVDRHTATFSGTYAGFTIERAPDLPGDRPTLAFGEVFVDGSPGSSEFATWSLLWPGNNEPGKFEAGTYRITLLADGPSEVTILVDGTASRDLTPADPVTASARTTDLTQPAGSAANVRAANLGPFTGGPETFALVSTLQHYTGSSTTDLCFAAARPGNPPDCPYWDLRNCGYTWGSESDPNAEHTSVTSFYRYPNSTTAGQTVVSPVDFEGYYERVVDPMLEACRWRGEGEFDAVVRTTATAWSATEPSTAFALFVRPAPMRSVVERLTQPTQ